MRAIALLFLAGVASGCGEVPATAAGEPAAVAVCGAEEPGERLILSGRVLDYAGRPLAKAAVVVYHAAADGLYNPKGGTSRVPRLRAAAVTDEAGRFRFATVRPGAYPDRSEPAHIHLSVVAPAHHVRHVAYWFDGDPLLTDQRRAEAAKSPEVVILKLVKAADGGWAVGHDLKLEGN